MAVRATRRAGLPKPRVDDQSLRIALDNIIERLEVLDGIRGDNLDRAVTFRDLDAGNFTVKIGGSGSYEIVDVPPAGGGGTPVPGIGPADPPTDLQVNSVFLALMISWVNPAFNLQHVEVYRSETDNLSTRQLIGTATGSPFMDYVGEDKTFYYWVRSVGTDGTYSAFHPTGPGGVEGKTSIDPGKIDINPNFFKLKTPEAGEELPFLIDADGNIGIAGNLIVKDSILATSIEANSITSRELFGDTVMGNYAKLGTVESGLFKTGPTAVNSFRVEIQDQVGTPWPIWYGSGAKGTNNGLFYVDRSGNVVIKGLMSAGMINQTLFAPSGPSYDQFKIATQYRSSPNTFSGGLYTGKKAHLFPLKTVHYGPDRVFMPYPIAGSATFSIGGTEFLGPLHSSSTEYGRLGQYANMFHFTISLNVRRENGGSQPTTYRVQLRYAYDGTWRTSLNSAHNFYFTLYQQGTTSATFHGVFRTRTSAFSTFDCGCMVSISSGYRTDPGTDIDMATWSVFTPNFGTTSDSSSLPLLS